MSSEREQLLLSQIEAITASLQRDLREAERELAESQQQRAEAARSGEMGKDWQDVQRRIDAGQTSLADVFTGKDESPAARRLQQLSQDNLTRMGQELSTDSEVRQEEAAAEAHWQRLAERAQGQGPAGL
jgi:hypothetical protein